MGLSSVLVDQARVWRRYSEGVQVEGRTTFSDDGEPGTWFAARLEMPQAEPESGGPGSPTAYRRVVLTPTLICDTQDFEGNTVDIRSSDYVEVQSDDLGQEIWQVTSAARPFRKRSGIIGFQVTLRRVEVQEFSS